MKLQCSWWRFGSVIWSRGGGNGQRNKYTNRATSSFCVLMSCHGWSQESCRNTREVLEVRAQPGTAQPRPLWQQVRVKQALRGLMASWPSLQATWVLLLGMELWVLRGLRVQTMRKEVGTIDQPGRRREERPTSCATSAGQPSRENQGAKSDVFIDR